VCVLENIAQSSEMTDCLQEADLESKSAVNMDTAPGESGRCSDQADTTQTSVQGDCTVKAGCTDEENNCTSATNTVLQLSQRNRQRLCKSGSKLFLLRQLINSVIFVLIYFLVLVFVFVLRIFFSFSFVLVFIIFLFSL